MSPSLAEASPSGLPPAPSRRQAGRIKPKMRLGLEKGVVSAGIIGKGGEPREFFRASLLKEGLIRRILLPSDKGDGPLTAKAA